MSELASVITTDEEIESALREARLAEQQDRHVVSAHYSPVNDSLLLQLEDGVSYSIPRSLLQGISEANSPQIMEIEILGSGSGLYWPQLDVAHSVAGLLAGVFGSRNWMQNLRTAAFRKQVSA